MGSDGTADCDANLLTGDSPLEKTCKGQIMGRKTTRAQWKTNEECRKMRLKGDGEKKVSFGGARVFEEFWGRSLEQEWPTLGPSAIFHRKVGTQRAGYRGTGSPSSHTKYSSIRPSPFSIPFQTPVSPAGR